MDEPKKYKCRCGKEDQVLRTYFKKGDTVRVTLCDSCSELHGFKGNDIYDSSLYERLTKEQQVKLPPTYAN